MVVMYLSATLSTYFKALNIHYVGVQTFEHSLRIKECLKVEISHWFAP